MNSKLSAFLLGLSFAAVYVLGCATARYVEPRVAAQAGAQRWEYDCFEASGDFGRTATREVNARAAQGWELVSGDRQLCMRRPL